MFRICRIIVETKEAADNLKQFLGGYPVEITTQIPDDDYYDTSTLMVGWNFTKDKFPNQKINDSSVIDNLSWTYNEPEAKGMKGQNFHRNIEDFVNKNLQAWLPSDFTLYDSIIYRNLDEFIENHFDKNILTYIHFNDGALYLRNADKNFVINAKSLWLTEPNYKSEITNLLNNMNCIIYSHDHIEDYVDLDLLQDIKCLDIIRWVKHGVETPIKYFQIVPNIDISKYVPFLMSMIPSNHYPF